MTSKQKEVVDELKELFDEIDNFPVEPTVVKEIGPYRPITANEGKDK